MDKVRSVTLENTARDSTEAEDSKKVGYHIGLITKFLAEVRSLCKLVSDF